jgi:hypothetical protein
METDRAEKIAEAFCGILSTQAFMFGEAVPAEALPDPGGELLSAAMEFSGPLSGVLRIAAPANMCVHLAGNTLGIEPDALAVEQSGDAFKELLNVTCGKILTDVAGDEPVFDLSVPEVSLLSRSTWNVMVGDPAVLKFSVDDFPVLLKMDAG